MWGGIRATAAHAFGRDRLIHRFVAPIVVTPAVLVTIAAVDGLSVHRAIAERRWDVLGSMFLRTPLVSTLLAAAAIGAAIRPALAEFAAIVIVAVPMLLGGVAWTWQAAAEGDWTVGAARAGLLVPAAWLASHAAYFAARHAVGRDRFPRLAADPLPYQKRAVEELVALISKTDSALPRVLSLRGAWGSGKSTILEFLRKKLARAENAPAVVSIDAWQLQRELSLEAALFREIARNWDVLRPFGWLARPIFRLLPVAFGRFLKLSFSFGFASAEVSPTGVGTLPRIWWREQLRALADLLARDGRRLVIIVDEVDRCEPVAAQQFVSLVPRFLLVPNVIVIVPTVADQLFFKVFDPLTTVLPDLQSTLVAVLYEECLNKNLDEHAAALESLIRDIETGSSAGGIGRQDSADSNAGDRGRSSGGSAAPSTVDPRLLRLLQQRYLRLPPHEKQRLRDLFEEKFFGATKVPIGSPKEDDIEQLLRANSGTIRSVLSDSYGLTEEQIVALARYARDQWPTVDSGVVVPGHASIRRVLGSLSDCLTDFRNIGYRPPLTPFRLAALAIHFGLRRALRGEPARSA